MWVVIGTAVGVAYSLYQYISVNTSMRDPAGHTTVLVLAHTL